mmetsp:Transcript_13662/g.23990  ORF Transcript_13662/g.23990 Transcript_13662/m.23990 type:complete len:355 (-) Transcript_13662:203-1267(-)
MAAFDRRDANLKKLQEADKIQDKTQDAILRIQRQTAEAEELGAQTLDELRRQGQQMDDINSELESVSSKLDTSRALQSKFDAWAGNWLGGKRRAAMNEAAAEIQERSKEEHGRIKEVFQHEKFDAFSRTWKRHGLVLCTDPTVACNDVFDPETAQQTENSRWIIDYSLAGIDPDGWTYAYDFNSLNRSGAGDNAPKLNSYVRRRKWRHVDRNGGSGGSGMEDVVARSDERKVKLAANNKHVDKIGYVPRNKQAAGMSASGLSSAGMMGRNRNDADQALDEDSAAGLQALKAKDALIDQGIDSLTRTIDNLGNISSAMKDEVNSHNQKLEKIDSSMQKATEKQTVVNARQRYLLK